MSTALETKEPQPKEEKHEVGSPWLYEHQMRQRVVPDVKEIDHSFTEDGATPNTSETPVPKTAELDSVEAHRIGSEEPEFVANIEHALKIGRSKLTGESVWARIGKAIRGAKIFSRRRQQQAQVTTKYDPHQMDIGE